MLRDGLFNTAIKKGTGYPKAEAASAAPGGLPPPHPPLLQAPARCSAQRGSESALGTVTEPRATQATETRQPGTQAP